MSNHKAWKHVTPSGTSKEDVAKFMAMRPTTNDVERTINIKRGFLTIIGGIMYAMVFTRPDIAFHTSRLAGFMQSPSTEAYEAALNVLHYLYATKSMGITYGRVRDDDESVSDESAEAAELSRAR